MYSGQYIYLSLIFLFQQQVQFHSRLSNYPRFLPLHILLETLIERFAYNKSTLVPFSRVYTLLHVTMIIPSQFISIAPLTYERQLNTYLASQWKRSVSRLTPLPLAFYALLSPRSLLYHVDDGQVLLRHWLQYLRLNHLKMYELHPSFGQAL